jgi:hypothetical protein
MHQISISTWFSHRISIYIMLSQFCASLIKKYSVLYHFEYKIISLTLFRVQKIEYKLRTETCNDAILRYLSILPFCFEFYSIVLTLSQHSLTSNSNIFKKWYDNYWYQYTGYKNWYNNFWDFQSCPSLNASWICSVYNQSYLLWWPSAEKTKMNEWRSLEL